MRASTGGAKREDYFDAGLFSMVEPVSKTIHFIWVGEKPLSAKYAYHVLKCALLNKLQGYDIKLWVNPEYFSDDASAKKDHMYEYVTKLQQNGITIKNYETEIPEPNEHKQVKFRQFMAHAKGINPAVAADVLRWRVLKGEGGIYCDIDNKFNFALPRERVLLPQQAPMLVNYSVFPEGVNNDFLVAPRDSEWVHEMVDYFDRMCDYGFADDLKDWSYEDVINRCGPRAVVNQLVNGDINRFKPCSVYGHPAFKDTIEFHCDVNWLDNLSDEQRYNAPDRVFAGLAEQRASTSEEEPSYQAFWRLYDPKSDRFNTDPQTLNDMLNEFDGEPGQMLDNWEDQELELESTTL